jgi:hypothetical protein
MPMSRITPVLIVVLAVLMLHPAVVLADVVAYWLDTSGSMRRHGFEEAKRILIQQIEAARPGDVLYVESFDISDKLLGRVAVGEDGSPDIKLELIAKVRSLKAKGQWTNLDLPVKAGKALLLEERVPGARRLVILSDGLSDPAPGFEKMDLQKIAAIVPQSLGFSLYLISLPEDLSSLFQMPVQESVVISAPEAPHIKGVPLQQFSEEKFGKAVKVIEEDVAAPTPPPVPVIPVVMAQEDLPPPTANVSSIPLEEGVVGVSQGTRVDPSPATSWPLPWLIGSVILAVIGAVPLWRQRKGHQKRHTFTLDLKEGEAETRQFALAWGENMKKTVGPRGDVPLGGPELPAMVLTLLWSKGQLWLTPLDRITVNGHSITTKTPLAVGDRIGVREHVRITIVEGRSDS